MSEIPTKTRRAKRRSPIDIGSLTIESGVVVPPRSTTRQSRWVGLLQRMQIGESVQVPDTTVAKLAYVKRIASELNIAIITRQHENGVRLWRVALDTNEDGL